MPTTWTAERVKALRTSLGLSQAQFAARLGCHVRAVSFWERGKRTPQGLYAKALDGLNIESYLSPVIKVAQSDKPFDSTAAPYVDDVYSGVPCPRCRRTMREVDVGSVSREVWHCPVCNAAWRTFDRREWVAVYLIENQYGRVVHVQDLPDQ